MAKDIKAKKLREHCEKFDAYEYYKSDEEINEGFCDGYMQALNDIMYVYFPEIVGKKKTKPKKAEEIYIRHAAPDRNPWQQYINQSELYHQLNTGPVLPESYPSEEGYETRVRLGPDGPVYTRHRLYEAVGDPNPDPARRIQEMISVLLEENPGLNATQLAIYPPSIIQQEYTRIMQRRQSSEERSRRSVSWNPYEDYVRERARRP